MDITLTEFIGEFIGTAMLILLGCGVNANTTLKSTYGKDSGWIVTSLGWAMAVFVGVFISAEASGAHLNPAVTLALAVGKGFAWAKVPGYLLAQLLGAITGASLVWLQYRPHYAAEPDPGAILGTFSTGPAIDDRPSNFISEFLGTFAFVLAVLFLTAPNFGTPDGKLGSLDALPVALVVLAIGLSLGGTTGYAINPARDLGPRIAHSILPIPGKGGSNWSYSWIPIVGPLAGGALAAVVHGMLVTG
ncbi:MAG: glycerol uptake facilitator protein [Neolewinella sp.]